MIKNRIQQLEKEIKQLKELAYKDELTKLYNRRGFSEEAKKFLHEVLAFKKYKDRRASIIVRNFSIAVFDIDNFKKFNDAYGHQLGDEVLKMVSRIVSDSVRDIDLAARWGGEEIVIGLVGANEHDAFRVADDIRQSIAKEAIKWKNKEISVTISGGVSGFESAETFDDIFHLADKALYEAKKRGKNVIIKSNELQKSAKKKKE